MPSFRKRPRKRLPPPLAGGGAADECPARGRGEKVDRIARARALRARYSDAENKLWQALRRKQIHGCRFRRQFPIGPYFADFVWLPARLVIEVDGAQHAEVGQRFHDARRTAWLQGQNFKVMRFWNDDVLNNMENVVETIASAVREAFA